MFKSSHIWAFLLSIVVICLNFDFVVQSFLGGSLILNSWVLIPAGMILIYVPISLLRGDVSSVTWIVILFMSILLVGSLRNLFAVGPNAFVWGFLSYGLWLGVFLWMQRQSQTYLLKLIISVFVLSAMLHTLVTFYELFSGQALMKFVTIGDKVERRYGISFSLAVLGLQLGCGALAALAALRMCRTTTQRVLTLICFYLIVLALYVTAIRAPLIYLFLATIAVTAVRYLWDLKNIVNVVIVATVTIVSGLLLDRFEQANVQFVVSAFDVSDRGNIERLGRYQMSLNLLVEKWWAPIFGYGPAILTQIPVAMGLRDFGSESSALKATLELGAVGLLPLAIHVMALAMRLFSSAGVAILKRHIEIFAIMAFIALECLTSEVFKSWIGSLYFVLALGLITRLTLDPLDADVKNQASESSQLHRAN